MTRPPKIMSYVQHLLGIGHLRRTATLARAMVDAGLDLTLVSGGQPLDGLELAGARLVQLPPTRAVDLYFKQLVDDTGKPIDDAWRQRRCSLLLDVFAREKPDLLMLELFPFGRRQMRFELIPLLDAARAARPRPVIVSSVRDILVGQEKPGRNDEMLDLVETYFNHVLVHGDPDFIPFDRTFPHARRIEDKIQYTGYVVDRSGTGAGNRGQGRGEVIVSAGGGAVGTELLRAAIRARPLSQAAKLPWRVLVGVSETEETFAELKSAEDSLLVVERARSDFPALLANCRMSISQGGYNTLMETLHARSVNRGSQAICVPYAGGIETEQTLRTRLLAEKGLLFMLEERDLSPQSLAAKIDQAMAAAPLPAEHDLDTAGAEVSARLVKDWARERAGT